MKLSQSEYLLNQKDKLKQLIQMLDSSYQYSSVLATDVTGMSYMYSQKRSAIAPNSFAERGFVVRVYKNCFIYSIEPLKALINFGYA